MASPWGRITKRAIPNQQSPILIHCSIPGYAAVTAFVVFNCALFATAQTIPTVTGNPRVDKLLSQMTLDEKIAMVLGTSEDPSTYQGPAGYLAGIPRLGIPSLRLADGLGAIVGIPNTNLNWI
jgi:beta-glucosidase